jgi:ssDNA-binding replication factor A large subunit
VDKFGKEIQATLYNEAVDKYADKFKQGGVYVIRNGQVKMANKKYTTIKSDFCLVLDL